MIPKNSKQIFGFILIIFSLGLGSFENLLADCASSLSQSRSTRILWVSENRLLTESVSSSGRVLSLWKISAGKGPKLKARVTRPAKNRSIVRVTKDDGLEFFDRKSGSTPQQDSHFTLISSDIFRSSDLSETLELSVEGYNPKFFSNTPGPGTLYLRDLNTGKLRSDPFDLDHRREVLAAYFLSQPFSDWRNTHPVNFVAIAFYKGREGNSKPRHFASAEIYEWSNNQPEKDWQFCPGKEEWRLPKKLDYRFSLQPELFDLDRHEFRILRITPDQKLAVVNRVLDGIEEGRYQLKLRENEKVVSVKWESSEKRDENRKAYALTNFGNLIELKWK